MLDARKKGSNWIRIYANEVSMQDIAEASNVRDFIRVKWQARQRLPSSSRASQSRCLNHRMRSLTRGSQFADQLILTPLLGDKFVDTGWKNIAGKSFEDAVDRFLGNPVERQSALDTS